MQIGDFFLVVPPAFGAIAQAELALKKDKIVALCKDLGLIESKCEWHVSLSEEGITISNLPLELGFALNIFLKIPTRILLRLKSFRCRDFPKLYKQTQKIDWKPFIDGKMPKIKASAGKSRLMMLKRIEKTVADGISKTFSMDKTDTDTSVMDVYVRLYDDTCTLSIDTSGLALYKRHHEKKVGQAPIRETIAAALLTKLMEHRVEFCPEQTLTLVDPMLGSGTFFLEAKNFGKGAQRKEYAFLSFPFIETKKNVFSKLFGANLETTLWKGECVGYDRNEKMLKCAQENLTGLSGISINEQDIFADLENSLPSSVMLICNPPYGKRIGFKDTPSLFFNKLLAMIFAKWKPCLSGIIVPDEVIRDKRFQIPSQFKLIESFKFLNGGVKVSFLILV
ncbi:MAG: hypothetical protein AB8G05_21450 [Oligoflexales bacterium]